ncbi:MAG: BamA/TamA family outer membrane protein [Planctomycetes bacterium]|nr:BamA/TamA family outer membrane protein [Planctomycetota bacterium]
MQLTEQQLAETPQSDKVLEIRILGNDTITTSQINDHISTRVGRPFDRSVVQRDVRRLANLGWFVDVKPLYESTPQGQIVIFQVVERPTIRYVTYLGNEKIRDKALAKQTNIKSGGAVDPYAVEEGRRKIAEHYQSKGYNNVQITIMEGTKPTDKGIVYLINEGTFEKVWDVEFIGNEFVSDGRLKTLVKSKPPKFLFFKGYMNREEIDADVDKLTAYYRSFGYFQARVSRKIDYYPGKKWIKLTYVIHEGLRYQIRSVRFLGNTKFEPTALADAAKLKAGEPFEQTKVREDQRWIQDLYGSHGYVYADIRPETVFLEEPGELDLIYHIDEGEQFRIGNIFVNISGDNPHTRIQTVINELSVRPGDIADIREIKSSRRRVQGSGIFHVDPATNVRPEITFRISEEGNEYGMANRPKKRSRRKQTPQSPPQGAGSRGFGGRSGGGMSGIRGQSPDDRGAVDTKSPADRGPLVLPPPRGNVQPPAKPRPAQETIIRGQSPEPQDLQPRNIASRPKQPVWWVRPQRRRPVAQTVRKPTNPYQHLRGQSPNVPMQNAYAALPANGVAQQPYGGQLVGATGPASTGPATAGAYAAQQGLQPVQYSENIPPPAGSFGPTPGFSANPVPGYQLYPDGRFGLPGQPYPDKTVDLIFNGQETQTGRLMFGVGVNSNAGLVGNIVLDERNFDWRRPPRSFEDIRNGTAFRGDRQRFRIDASPGSQVNRYLISFQEPHLFDGPTTLGLSGSFFDRRYRDWDESRLGGRVSWGYQWVEKDLSANMSYRGENVTIDQAPNAAAVPELAAALGTNSLHGFKLITINDTRDSTFLPTQGRYLELSGEYVTGSFDYPRVGVDYRRFFLLRERPDHSGRHVLSFSTNVGWMGKDAPIYEHFFAGGFTTMRGFDFRGASPVDAATRVEVGGHFQWLNSLQYLFPITADEMLHGVVFCDFGTVESEVKIRDFRVVPGFGLRVTVPALGPAPIALDFGFPVNKADTDDTQVFSFSMGFGR